MQWKHFIKDYFVSEAGDVAGPKKMLKPLASPNKTFFYFINGRGHQAHRLVAQLFIGDIVNKKVLHKDGNKKNNHYSNLIIKDIKGY